MRHRSRGLQRRRQRVELLPARPARSRVYRWNEDGLAGISDDKGHLCFAVALWPERDLILKERLFGLAGLEGNHGEDVKEYYFYLDSTPSHSWMRMLYKYPQAAYPYAELVAENARRSKEDPEYELLDTGIFDDDRYFDVFVEYAKAGANDILIRIRAINRGPDPAPLHLLPTLWFRNTWAWGDDLARPTLTVGRIARADAPPLVAIRAAHAVLGDYTLACAPYDGAAPTLLFTENDTNVQRLFGAPNPTPYVKDAFHTYVVAGDAAAVNPAQTGTKAAAHYQLILAPGSEAAIHLRLSAVPAAPMPQQTAASPAATTALVSRATPPSHAGSDEPPD